MSTVANLLLDSTVPTAMVVEFPYNGIGSWGSLLCADTMLKLCASDKINTTTLNVTTKFNISNLLLEGEA